MNVKNKKTEEMEEKKASQNRGRSDRRSNSNKKNRNKGNKNTKPSDRNDAIRDCNISPDNDPKWYMKNMELFKSAANYWLSQVTGNEKNFNVDTSSAIGVNSLDNVAKVSPGIMTLAWMPAYGHINYDDGSTQRILLNSNLDAAAKNVYGFTVHGNSRNKSYDSPDLMAAILACDQVFSAIAMGIRAYGLINTLDQQNRYLSDDIISALGFDPTACRRDMPGFLYYINQLIARASVIWVPNSFPLVERHYWMNTNIYMDSKDITGQIYAYKQQTFYQWSGIVSTTGSALVPTSVPGNLTPAAYFNFVTTLLDAIVDDQDVGMMMGDMLKAYGAENLFSLQPIENQYTVLPVFNEEVLLQIHNTDFYYINPANVNVFQDANGHLFQVNTAPGSAINLMGGINRLLDFPMDYQKSDEAVMVSTRNKLDISEGRDGSGNIISTVASCGTELFLFCAIHQRDASGALQYFTLDSMAMQAPSGTLTIAQLRLIELLSQFDYAPFLYVVENASGNATQTVHAIIGDINDSIPISSVNVDRLNTVAFMSEMDVPIMIHGK